MRPDDLEAVRRSRAGDRAAFEQVYRGFYPVVLARVRGSLRDWDEARSAAQDAFLHAWRAFGTLRDVRAFPSWLLSIADNEVRMLIRARAAHRGETALPDGYEAEAPKEGLPPAEVDEVRRALDKVIEDLPEKHREAVLLRVLASLDYGEIAGRLGMTYDQAKGIVARGLAKAAVRLRAFAPGGAL